MFILPILLVFKSNFDIKIITLSLLMCAKFKDNRITCLAVFCKCIIRRKKPRKLTTQKACIFGMAGAIYFKAAMQSPLICRHLHSRFGLVWIRNHIAKNERIVFVSIYHRLPLLGVCAYKFQKKSCCLLSACAYKMSTRCFNWESVVRGHHIYKDIWTPLIVEIPFCDREEDN